MKRIFTTLFVIFLAASNLMAVNVWDGSSEPWTNGSGTADDPYLIETAANLAYLAEKVNEGYQAQGMAVFAKTYFLMTDDLDLNNINWTPIGNISSNMEGFCFAGYFDGGYHTISNLYIQTNAEITGLFAGLINVPEAGFGEWSYIGNLFVTSANINSTGTGAGGIVGAMAEASMVGNCCFSGAINVTNSGDYCGAGGIAALTAQDAFVACCSFSGSIQATNNGGFMGAAGAGGIVGIAMDNTDIAYCYNTGTITANATMISVAAGIVGATLQSNGVSIGSCYNVGTVNAATKGGIFGMISPINPTKGGLSLIVQACYYLNTCGGTTNYGTSMTADQMRSEDFLPLIDHHYHVFVMDNGTNNGYPIHGMVDAGYVRCFNITDHSAKLSAQIHQGNETIERAYFRYKVWPDGDWMEVDVPCDGYVEVELDNLEPETEYEYILEILFPDGFVNDYDVDMFQTLAYDAVASQEAPEIRVYPNPTTDVIHVQGVDVNEIQIFNVLGQLVKTVRGTNDINVNDLESGQYLFHVVGNDGGAIKINVVR